MPQPVEVPSTLRQGPFTTMDAQRAGLSWKVLQSSRFRRVFRGVYVWAGLDNDLLRRCQAALLLAPAQTVLSHRTAALLQVLPIDDDGQIHVTLPPGSTRLRVQGIAVHHSSLDDREVMEIQPKFGGTAPDGGAERASPGGVEHLGPGDLPPPLDGVPVWQMTRPERTFTDLAGVMGESRLVDLVVVGDAIVRRRLASRADLLQVASRVAARVGSAATRSKAFRSTGDRSTGTLASLAAELVRERVDSPMETRLRLLLVLAGLPCPETNLPVHGPAGDILAVVDLQYPEQRIVLEYDGDVHRTEKHKWRRDRSIRRTMGDLGWDVHAFDGDDLACTPEQTIARVHAALRVRGHPGLPRRPIHQWRPYFPIRRPSYIDEDD